MNDAFDFNLLFLADYDLFEENNSLPEPNIYDGVHDTPLGIIVTYTTDDFIM